MSKAADLGLSPAFSSMTKPTGTSINNLRGATGVGKTYTLLKTCPGPVAYLNIDRDNDLMLDRLRTKFGCEIFAPKRYALKFDNDIMRARDQVATDNAVLARRLRDRFIADYQAALDSKVRFIVIDQSNSVWSMLRIARWGKLTEIPQILYSQANWEMESLVHRADDTGKVVFWISQSEEVWEEVIEDTPGGPRKTRRPTGKFRTAGYKAFDSMMSSVLELHYDIEENKRTMHVLKGIANMGKELVGKEITVPNIMTTITGREWK